MKKRGKRQRIERETELEVHVMSLGGENHLTSNGERRAA